jgi:SAM-dependent methyltransferase
MKHSISLQSEDEALRRTLSSSYCPAPIKEARERQDEVLLQRLRNSVCTIADIGCGNGYHAVLLAASARLYHGFEVSADLAEAARALWRKERTDYARVFVGDAALATLDEAHYDIVLCLYFTPGNIRDRSEDLQLYSGAYLDSNPRFIRVMSRFHRAMKTGGRMFLTLYKDVPGAEAAQVDYYEHTGQRVVTPSGSRFVATAEGFWSARWTRESLLSNLDACGIHPDAVVWNDLNEIAWLVEVAK